MADLAGWMSGLYVAIFLPFVLLLLWWGERNWLLSLLLFAPAYVLLLPLALLTPLCLFFRPGHLLWHLGCVVLVVFFYMDFSWTRRPERSPDVLKVITFNAGQGDRAQFESFVKEEEPDILILQDARYKGAEYARRWPDRFVAGRGEYFVISRYPVQRADFVEKPSWGGRPVAARFEVLRDGKLFVIYNVHLPTPRAQLSRFLSRRVVHDIFGNEENGKTFESYRESVEARIDTARELSSVFASERLSFIACGDFNTPDRGYTHRILSAGMIDAHSAAGQGWGLTFPGGTRGRAAKHGPWLRIDYAYAGRGWKPVFCRTDPGRRSQHRAVAAHFVPADQ